MSTEARPYCVDCKEESPDEWQRWYGATRVVKHAAALVALRKSDEDRYFEVRVVGGSWVDMEWLEKHAGHTLALKTDYGTIEDVDGDVVADAGVK